MSWYDDPDYLWEAALDQELAEAAAEAEIARAADQVDLYRETIDDIGLSGYDERLVPVGDGSDLGLIA
jgi:hypothetical protein